MTKQPTDLEVLIEALHKRALARAERTRCWSIEAAWQHFGPTEQTGRDNALRLAEKAYGAAIEKADQDRLARLADIKTRAES